MLYVHFKYAYMLIRVDCEIPGERVLYLSALEVCSRQGAMQIHVYLYLYFYLMQNNGLLCRSMSFKITDFGTNGKPVKTS